MSAICWLAQSIRGSIFFQYFSANIGGKLPWAAALQPVMAMVSFWTAITIVRNGWGVVFRTGRV